MFADLQNREGQNHRGALAARRLQNPENRRGGVEHHDPRHFEHRLVHAEDRQRQQESSQVFGGPVEVAAETEEDHSVRQERPGNQSQHGHPEEEAQRPVSGVSER